MFYHQATNAHIREGVPFTLNGVQYPANWLNLATPADKAELGLTECVVVGQREDDRFYYVSEELVGNEIRIVNTPKPQAQIDAVNAQIAKQAKDEADAAAARADAKLQAIAAMTPAQIRTWVENNVTNLAQAKDAIATLGVAVSVLARKL